MKDLLLEGEALNKQGGSVWIGRDGGSFVMVIPLRNVSGEDDKDE